MAMLSATMRSQSSLRAVLSTSQETDAYQMFISKDLVSKVVKHFYEGPLQSCHAAKSAFSVLCNRCLQVESEL